MMDNIYAARVEALRGLMKSEGLDAYLITSEDFHGSEYVDDYFKCRSWISGFTGSAATVVVTADEACLWTDGRYFLQASEQLKDSGIRLQKMGEPGVPTVPDYLAAKLQAGQTLGFDGRTVSISMADGLQKKIPGLLMQENIDLVGDLWTDRPPFPAGNVWLLDEQYSGCSRANKLRDLREELRKNGADRFLLTSLDDIAWLYNIRGCDVAYNPVAMAYTVVTQTSAVLYIALSAVSTDVRAALEADGVELRPYLQVYRDVTEWKEGSVQLSAAGVNAALYHAIPAGPEILDRVNPTETAKAIKNATEQKNIRLAHIQDGVAVTKLLFRLKQLSHSGEYLNGMTELDVADMLLQLRKVRPGFLDQSFSPIVATGPHGAIVHYGPTPETNIPLVKDSFLLMDTGGQYLQGTTDITRTVIMGTASEKMKLHYTAVLRGHLDLAAVKFPEGTPGGVLDTPARIPLWDLGLDFRHGTGHGVGYLLNVHEGPQRISRGVTSGTGVPMEAGMLTSDEPGVYLTGEYGIRTENLVLCVEKEQTEYGRFLGLETVTMVPYDREAILPGLLTQAEKAQLNAYHRKVQETLTPYMTDEEAAWLAEACSPI